MGGGVAGPHANPLSKAEDEELQRFCDRTETRGGIDSSNMRVLIAITIMQSGSRIITTKGNRFGFVKGHAMIDDQICLFDGAALHYSLRECLPLSSTNEYRITGEIYLHHAMNGEVDALGLESYEITLV